MGQRLMWILDWLGIGCPAIPETWMDRTACAVAEQGATTLLPVLLGIVLIGALVAAAARRLSEKDLASSEAFLYSSSALAAPPVKRPRADPAPRTQPGEESVARSSHELDPDPSEDPDPDPTPKPGPVQSDPQPSDPPSTPGTHPGTLESDGRSLEGTLQLLPGRLEIPNGSGGRKEIRFVRVPGAAPEISFGRSDGLPHRHVQLSSPTVSRQHARMRFDGTRWLLINESSTNPTRVNGRNVDAAAGGTALTDGDQIEMGEVELVFRQEQVKERLPLRSSWYTDRGRRPSNQDAIAVRTLQDGRELAIVCDGMGGHSAGAIASHTALEAFVKHLENGGVLEDAVAEANRAVRSEAAKAPEREGMGTTLVALLRDGDVYRVANVGDSRAYRVDTRGLRQLTKDHSFVAEVVRDGKMSLEEAETSPWRNAVTRHLGAEDHVDVDLYGPYEIAESHTVILCSDGVHGVLSDGMIESLIRDSASVQDLAREAGEAALRGGGDDNVSVAALRFGRGAAVTPAMESSGR